MGIYECYVYGDVRGEYGIGLCDGYARLIRLKRFRVFKLMLRILKLLFHIKQFIFLHAGKLGVSLNL
jgi:hypothetical protein